MSASEESIATTSNPNTNTKPTSNVVPPNEEMVGTEKMTEGQTQQQPLPARAATASDAASSGAATPTPQETSSFNGYYSDSNSVSSSEGIDVSTLDPATLSARIKAQVEYYFSQQNLNKDAYMMSQMNAEGYISIAVIAEFKKVKKLTQDVNTIVEAIGESQVCCLNDDKTAIKATWKRPARTTIILREVEDNTTEEEVLDLFKDTEFKVVSARPDVGNTWFVQMDNENDAKEALLFLVGRTFKGTAIKARLKSENVLRGSAPTWQPMNAMFAAGAANSSATGAASGAAGFGYGYPSMNGYPGYTPRGWDPRVPYQGSAEWAAAEQSGANAAGSGASQRSPRNGSPANGARASNGQSAPKRKGAKGVNASAGANQGAQVKSGAAKVGVAKSANPSKGSKKADKVGGVAAGAAGPGRKKKGTNAAGNAAGQSQQQVAASKKLKTPVFQPQDFPSLPMGKISLEESNDGNVADTEEDAVVEVEKVAEPVVTVAAIVAAGVPEKTEVVPTPPVVEDKEAVAPVPTQPEQEANPTPTNRKTTKQAQAPPATSSWAAAVAKNPPAPVALKASETAPAAVPKKASAAKKASKSAKQAVEATSETAAPEAEAVAAAVEAPVETASPSKEQVPRPARGWEKPGLPKVLPLEKIKQQKEKDQTSAQPPAVTGAAKKEKGAKGKKGAKANAGEENQVEKEIVDEIVESAADIAEASTAAAAAGGDVAPTPGAWGQKSFLEIIKENADKPIAPKEVPATSTDEVESEHSSVDLNKPLRSSGGFFGKGQGDRVANLEGNWREQARNHRAQQEEAARKRN